MKKLISTLLALIMVSGCSKNQLPDPYAGFKHTSVEQGYWSEITNGKQTIGELHFHSKGFSITYSPFETYKDYWGAYTLNEKNEIGFIVDSGNQLPAFSIATGKLHKVDGDEISISGIGLDSRRPSKVDFSFKRINPKQ
jgi:hypothetical protein